MPPFRGIMAYTTVDNIKNYLPRDLVEILSDDNDTDEIDPEKVNYDISLADHRIDGYLRGRYDLPLTVVPSLISDFSTILAVYYLYGRTMQTAIPPSLKDIYKDVINSLKEIQAGKLNPFEVKDNPKWYVSNKPTGSVSTVQAATNGWQDYLIRSTGTPGYNQNTRFLNPGSL